MAEQFKARPTTYKGVQMRSRLEAGFAQWLDEQGAEWSYEPQAFASGAGQYLPDFLVENISCPQGAMRAYVEVKPRSPEPGGSADACYACYVPSSDIAALARRMQVIWASEPDAVILLVWPGLSAKGDFPAFLRLWPCAALGEENEGVDSVFLPTLILKGPSATPIVIGPPVSDLWPDGYWDVK